LELVQYRVSSAEIKHHIDGGFYIYWIAVQEIGLILPLLNGSHGTAAQYLAGGLQHLEILNLSVLVYDRSQNHDALIPVPLREIWVGGIAP
jgi:hypothetical protein